jgi:hypothetical protein
MTRDETLKHIHAIVDKEVSLAMSTESPYVSAANALLREDRAATHRTIQRLEDKLAALSDIVSGCEQCSIEADLKGV